MVSDRVVQSTRKGVRSTRYSSEVEDVGGEVQFSQQSKAKQNRKK